MTKPRATISDFVGSLLIEEVSNICPLCGTFERTKKEFTFHHINHDPSVSEYWNLIRICRKCHDELTEYRTDGTRERRVKLVKRRLVRDYFGPVAIAAMKVAREKGSATTMPTVVAELCAKNLMRMTQENVLTVGPATNISTFDVYGLTEEGMKLYDNVFGKATNT